MTVLGADRPFEHLHTSSTADQKLIPPTTPYPDQRKTYTLYYPLPSTTPYTLYYPLPQNIHGAAPPRLSHPTAPPDPRQPYPTAPLYPLAPIRNRLHLTRSPTAQPHPTPYRGVHVDRSIATVPAPLPPPPPRKGPPRSNRATPPREAWGLPQSASFRRRPVQSHLFRGNTPAPPAATPGHHSRPLPPYPCLCSCSAG